VSDLKKIILNTKGPAGPMSFILIPLILMLMLPVSSSAGLYKYVDSEGKIHFTNDPPAGVKAKQMKIRKSTIEVPTYGDESDTGTGEESTSDSVEKRPYSDIKVVMYMTSWCPYCRKARKYIKSLGVRLMQYDIEKDPGKNQEMINKGYGKGVPLIDVEGIIIRGYNPDAIKAAVERRRLK
jgi:glutaredoxin